jgi:hypothetical protein
MATVLAIAEDYTGAQSARARMPSVRHNSPAARHFAAASGASSAVAMAAYSMKKERAMKMLADFTFAAAAALAIGIAIGGTALSLVWLVAVLHA